MAYIDREALKVELQKKIELSHNAMRAVIEEDFETIIDDMPAYDVVEVVRCKDCKYYHNAIVNKKGFLVCPASGMEITDYDYCSYGERKEGDD